MAYISKIFFPLDGKWENHCRWLMNGETWPNAITCCACLIWRLCTCGSVVWGKFCSAFPIQLGRPILEQFPLLSLAAEKHHCATRSTFLHLNPSSFRMNMRKFCPIIILLHAITGMTFLYPYVKSQEKYLKRALYQYHFVQYYLV